MLELSGEKVVLRESSAAHLPFIDMAEQAPENALFIGRWNTDTRLAAMKNPDYLNITVFDKTGRPVGFLILKGLTGTDRCITIYRIVITEKGQGFGKEALNLTLDYIFRQKKAHRVAIDAVEDNVTAINLYKKAGFIVEGVLRENMLYPEGYKSLVLLSILEDEYLGEKNEKKYEK